MPSDLFAIMSLVIMVGISGDLSIANLLVSALVIIGLLVTVRANMSSVMRDRAEAAEEEAKELQQENIGLIAKIAALESRPDYEKLYALMEHHDNRTAAFAEGIQIALGEIASGMKTNTAALETFINQKTA